MTQNGAEWNIVGGAKSQTENPQAAERYGWGWSSITIGKIHPQLLFMSLPKKKWGAFIDFCLLFCHPRKVKTLEGPMVLGEPCWPPWISWNHLEAVTKGKVVCDLGLCVLRALCCLPSFYFLTQHNGLMVLPSVSGHCFISATAISHSKAKLTWWWWWMTVLSLGLPSPFHHELRSIVIPHMFMKIWA